APSFEWSCRNSGGQEFPAEIHLVQLPFPDRRLVRGSILDITERRRTENARRDIEARYRGMVDHATYGIGWASEPEGLLLSANPALAEMLGYSSTAELLAVQQCDLLYRDPSERAKLAAEFVKHGRVEGTVEWKRKDGKIITVHLNARLAVEPDGQA